MAVVRTKMHQAHMETAPQVRAIAADLQLVLQTAIAVAAAVAPVLSVLMDQAQAMVVLALHG